MSEITVAEEAVMKAIAAAFGACSDLTAREVIAAYRSAEVECPHCGPAPADRCGGCGRRVV